MIRGNMNSIISFITLLTVFLVIVYNAVVKLTFSNGYKNNLLYRNVSQFCLFGSL